MEYFKLSRNTKINGSVTISGAKNAVLPLICATLLSENECEIRNMPDVADVKTLQKLMDYLGSDIEQFDDVLKINAQNISSTKAVYDIVRQMRASVLVLGPLLARFGVCQVSLPGGCAIGDRPIDLHLKAMEALGAQITVIDGYVEARAENGLIGSEIVFDKITVGGTENAVMAASLAHGESVIINAAREPEVIQLCEYIQSAGVEICGIGTSEIKIQGTAGKALNFPPVEVIPDRIEAGTYMCAAAITGSKLELNKVDSNHLFSVIRKLEEMGCHIECVGNNLTISREGKLKPVDIITSEYPGFPTDMQAQFMAVLTQADGVSSIEENLFENRFMNVAELRRMGAGIHLSNHLATIHGPIQLRGTDVTATDLRASASLVIAALVAEGETSIHQIYHLLRGYDNLRAKFMKLGVEISTSFDDFTK